MAICQVLAHIPNPVLQELVLLLTGLSKEKTLSKAPGRLESDFDL